MPPPTIRVFRTATGAVETVDFRTYAKNVLSREWIGSWTTESLRSGALAVKHYAWYQVLHWRGYTNTAGQCFDVFDSTPRPGLRPVAARPSAAGGGRRCHLGHARPQERAAIFATYYNAGATNEACGANANGWQMFQWGTQACGLAGKTAAQIMATYYTGVTVSAAPAPVPPSAAPVPTPVPTPRPTPTPTPRPTPIPAPTALRAMARRPPRPPSRRRTRRRRRPRPTPVPTPPPAQQQPGGGQSGIVAPPPPPPVNPEPIVVSVEEAVAPTEAIPVPRTTPRVAPPASRVAVFEAVTDARAARAAARPAVPGGGSQRHALDHVPRARGAADRVDRERAGRSVLSRRRAAGRRRARPRRRPGWRARPT